MINIRTSTADEPSARFTEAPRRKRENNLTWLQRNLSATGEEIHLLLIGGVGPADFRLRVAQSHLRRDLTPSHWSHVALLTEVAEPLASTVLQEISLQPRKGFGFPAPTNGSQEGRLGDYRSRRAFPNIAVLRLPVAPEAVRPAIRRFQNQRVILDAVELVLLWLAFAWGVGRTGNPLLEGNGIPSAAMIEVIMGAVGYDLTPGLESRASCPEAIWQAARWWHGYYTEQEAPAGAWHVEHFLVDEYD